MRVHQRVGLCAGTLWWEKEERFFFWQNAEQRDGSKLWDFFFFPVSLLSACAPPMTSISSLSDRYTQSVLRSYTYMANAEKWHNEEAGERLCSDEGIRGKEGPFESSAQICLRTSVSSRGRRPAACWSACRTSDFLSDRKVTERKGMRANEQLTIMEATVMKAFVMDQWELRRSKGSRRSIETSRGKEKATKKENQTLFQLHSDLLTKTVLWWMKKKGKTFSHVNVIHF